MPVQIPWMNHTTGGVVFYTCDMASPISLGSVMSMSAPLNTETQGDDGGQTYDKTHSIVSQQPVFSVETKAISKALQAVTPDGICICSEDEKYGVNLFGQARDTCGENGDKPGASEHLKYTVNWGLATPLVLSGSRGGDMSLTMQIDCLTDEDSVNAPFAIAENSPLPTGLDLSQYTLGSMIIGDIIMDDITDFSLDFSVNIAEKLPALGNVWPKTLSTAKHLPVLTLSGRNPRRLDDYVAGQATTAGKISWLGEEAAKTTTQVRFRKRKNRGTFEPDASPVHLQMEMHGLIVVDNPFDASGGSRAQTTIRVIGVEDDITSNEPQPVAFRYDVTYADFQPTP